MMLVKKSVASEVVEEKSWMRDTASGTSTASSGVKPREQVFLEKTKPPKVDGDDCEFPEFRRKWTSLVTNANFPEETEIDKLRDSIPKEAKAMLYGVTKLSEAWDIMVKIGQKVKNQL